MQDRPTAPELLEAVATFLSDDLMPGLEGREKFHVRVSANLLRILAREWTLEPAHREEDRVALAELLDRDGSLEELAAELVSEIRDDTERDSEILSVLRGIARRKLLVNNPGYIRDPS